MFDGNNSSPTQSPVASFSAFEKKFNQGAYVAAGDVNGDGRADIIVGKGAGNKSTVRVFDGMTYDLTNPAMLAEFSAYEDSFGGGVRVGAAMDDTTGRALIFTGPGPGGGTKTKVFRLSELGIEELEAVFAYDPDYSGGLYVSGGN